MPTPTELEWQSLTRVIEEVRTPYTFVTDLLFSEFNTNPTETIGIDSVIGGRRMAPFVTPGASGHLIPGMSHQFSTVTAPNIKAKRPFSARQLLFERTPGSPIFVDGGEIVSQVGRRIARDLKYAREQIDQTLEWMCCQALTGVLTYNIATADGQPGDAFTIDYGRPGAHTVALTGNDTWDTAAASATSHIEEHVQDAKELISDKIGVPVTDCILGASAANAFKNNERVRADLDNRRITPGTLELAQQYRANGAIFLGEVYDVRFWRYSRSITDPFGNATTLIGTDKAHFVSATPGAENVVEYGAIDDLDALEGGMLESRFFSKSWREKDPSAQMYLWQSRPLPVPRRPESMMTYTVV